MNRVIPSLIVVLAMVSSGCNTPTSAQNDEQENARSVEAPATSTPPPAAVASEWSKPVNGLKARWLVNWNAISSDKHPTYAHYREFILEVKNVGGDFLSFNSQPTFKNLTIRNANGKVIQPPGHIHGNHINGIPQWAVVPDSTYLGLRIDTAIPVHVGVHFESFVTENHSLHATLVAKKQDGPENQWTGEIELPALFVQFSGEAP